MAENQKVLCEEVVLKSDTDDKEPIEPVPDQEKGGSAKPTRNSDRPAPLSGGWGGSTRTARPGEGGW